MGWWWDGFFFFLFSFCVFSPFSRSGSQWIIFLGLVCLFVWWMGGYRSNGNCCCCCVLLSVITVVISVVLCFRFMFSFSFSFVVHIIFHYTTPAWSCIFLEVDDDPAAAPPPPPRRVTIPKKPVVPERFPEGLEWSWLGCFVKEEGEDEDTTPTGCGCACGGCDVSVVFVIDFLGDVEFLA